jgi:tetratricopeptide (TPR) repeat protein
MKILSFIPLLLFFEISPGFPKDENPEKIYQEAIMCYAAGDYENALKNFLQLTNNSNKFKDLNFNIGLCYYSLNDFTPAIEFFQKEEKDDPTNFRNLVYLARCFKIIGKPRLAIDYYNKAIKLKPDYYSALYDLGIIYYENRNFETAENYFQACIQLRPEDVISHHYMGLCFFNESQNDSAISYFQTALKYNPNFIQSINSLGSCYYLLKNYDQAILSFSKSLNLDNQSASTYRKLGDCYSKLEKYDEALISYRNAHNFGDSTLNTVYNLAWSFYRLEMYDSTIKYFKWLTINDWENGKRYIDLGGAYYVTGKYDMAEKEFEKGVELLESESLPYLAQALTRSGISLHQQKLYNLAVTRFKRAIEIQPYYNLAYYNLAVALDAFEKNKKEIMKSYEKFLEIAKDDKNSQENIETAKNRLKALKGK